MSLVGDGGNEEDLYHVHSRGCSPIHDGLGVELLCHVHSGEHLVTHVPSGE